MATRTQVLVRGIVQGVGFRPFVYTLASRTALQGRVLNNGKGLLIDLEGDRQAIDEFVIALTENPPPLAQVESIERSDNLQPRQYPDFRILESNSNGQLLAPVSADIATCTACLEELFDPHDRRYHYPFINCTNCGPRFTIIEDIPYDRSRTTMRDFEMCAQCRAEYENPLNRRFHAEPIACHVCGPQLTLVTSASQPVGAPGKALSTAETTISTVLELLLAGNVVAIKGLGGFHLACDALNTSAVERLRQRKYREDKPFAMMAANVNVIRQHCMVSAAEERLLLSKARPIVLLEKLSETEIPRAVAPGVNSLGFMLPYSPLHYLLLRNLDRPLVMTSGNVSDEPICFTDEQALEHLGKIADYFLLHDRRIHMRTDDSVTRVFDSRAMALRRSRGYAPEPIKTALRFETQILACGAELKNTFCIGRGTYAYVSHHIGDLENLETLRSFTEGIEHFKRLFHLHPEVVAYDLHPEYLSTKYALALEEIGTKVGIQHHHAHIASCMADNQIDGEVIGVAMDGLGFGTDGRLWGGEFFIADFVTAERIAHLAYVPMPGGVKAIREPWRMAAVYLQQTFGDEFLDLDLTFVKELAGRGWPTLRSMVAAGTNCPKTSSMGRLFDTVSALLGIRPLVNYEGQAAIELEAIANVSGEGAYEFAVAEGYVIDAQPVIRAAVEDLLAGRSQEVVAAKFHATVAHLIATIAKNTREERKLNRVVLSGGVFQNVLLLNQTCRLLRVSGFEVFMHSRVPTNDGGISLGQASIANARISAGRIN